MIRPEKNMSRKSKKRAEHETSNDLSSRNRFHSKDLWIAPRYSLKGPAGERAWEDRPFGGPPNSARFLELADIALGLKKPSDERKTNGRARAHAATSKT